MGLTETRALDFDRVFVLDMNEGTVPQTSMPDGFLPLDLRHALRTCLVQGNVRRVTPIWSIG